MQGTNRSANILITKAEVVLTRALSTAQGRYDALQFAWTHRNALSQIEDEILEQQELIVSLQKGPLAPGASPRIYKDAYIAGLKEAIDILNLV